jgi:hypothetical protein
MRGLGSVTLVLSILSTAACGANVVYEPGGGEGGQGGNGGDGSGASPTTSSSPTTTTTLSGTSLCSDHTDCAPTQLCQFGTGACIDRCGPMQGCSEGFVCDPCATSSCPFCNDCAPGCLPFDPPPPVACDDHADCGSSAGQDVCIFSVGLCAQRCGPGSPPCPPNSICDDCATSSCPGCRDCIGACSPTID